MTALRERWREADQVRTSAGDAEFHVDTLFEPQAAAGGFAKYAMIGLLLGPEIHLRASSQFDVVVTTARLHHPASMLCYNMCVLSAQPKSRDQRMRGAIEAQLQAAEQICSHQGAQLTELRRSVLSLILEANGPSTAYQLLDRLKRSRKGVTPSAIYRALDFLIEQRLINRIELLKAFVPCAEAGHRRHAVHFLICRTCGSVAVIEDRAISEALEQAAQRKGFQPDDTTVELAGACAACALLAGGPGQNLAKPSSWPSRRERTRRSSIAPISETAGRHGI